MAVVLVRHAPVEVDPSLPPALWPLSDAGRAAARALAREPLWDDIDRIFTSPELKAHETAQIIAGPNGITVTLVEDLREVERPTIQWLDDYPAAVTAYLARPEDATHGWETPAEAQARIRTCIDDLRHLEPEPFAVLGHGLTLSLYLASVTGRDAGVIWPAIRLPDIAIVEPDRGNVVRGFGEWQVGSSG